MLRRPPTVLTLTSEDVKSYEDRHETEAFKERAMAATAAHHHHHLLQHSHRRGGVPQHHNQLTRSMSGMDITGITTSSSEGEYEYEGEQRQQHEEEEEEEEEGNYDEEEEEEEANQSYVPNRPQEPFMSMRQVRERARWRGLLGPADEPPEDDDVERGGQGDEGELEGEEGDIYRNAEDDPFTGGNTNSNSDPPSNILSERHPMHGAEEDEDMLDAEDAHLHTQPQRRRLHNHHAHPEPPPAPSRITTRSTRTGSREPTSATASTAARYATTSLTTTTTAAAPASSRAAPSRRAPPHSGRSTTTATAMGQHHEAVTPTPGVGGGPRGAAAAQGGTSAFVTPETRVTRSRDERIGVAGTRGAGRR